MAAYIARDFAATGRVADMDRICQVEGFDKLREIVRIGVEVVAVPGLTRTAMASAIMANAAVSVGAEEEHLVFKGVCRQPPTMSEHNPLPHTPVLEINPGAVFGFERRHLALLFIPAPDLDVDVIQT